MYEYLCITIIYICNCISVLTFAMVLLLACNFVSNLHRNQQQQRNEDAVKLNYDDLATLSVSNKHSELM